MRTWREGRVPEVTPSPNIWNWPEVYEAENSAQDPAGALWEALRAERDWAGLDVVDVGCGDGFHLPFFAGSARSVIGVEPHAPLAERARARISGTPGVDVVVAPAQRLPLADGSADLVHARTAYFFGPGCEPGLAEAERVLRPGGTIAIIDLDTAAAPYGAWMRADAPQIDPGRIESFFTRHHFTSTSVPTRWCFEDRRTLEAVLGIEFSARTAARAAAETPGRTLPVTYRLRTRTRPTGLLTP